MLSRKLAGGWLVVLGLCAGAMIPTGVLAQNGLGAGSNVTLDESLDPVGPDDPWYVFKFNEVGSQAGEGSTCALSGAGNTVAIGNPPWTFTTTGIVALTITDAFLIGDAFEVLDFGVPVGRTPNVPASGGCGGNPDVCLANPNVSHAVFFLGTGSHSITIEPIASPFDEGCAHFRLDPRPQSIPAMAMSSFGLLLTFLLLAGFGALALLRTRRA